MPIFSKEEMKRIIEENNLKTMEDLDGFIAQLEKRKISPIKKK